ncbi:MAG TPA: glycosyltransferase family 2 protein [Elusimicrobiota bacterium]|nr:glycosyltransferase family 2 protein [Elusimicrobiota bacterium]
MTAKISIVTSMYRSADTIQEFCRRAGEAARRITPEYEIVLVNDGSPDNALELALDQWREDPNIVVVDLARNVGQHRALLTGLAQSRGDLIFMLDADLEEDPCWLSLFYERAQAEQADLVCGVQRRRKGGYAERASGSLFYALFNWLSDTRLAPNATTARLMTRRFVRNLLRHQERTVFLAGLIEITGYRQILVPVDKGSRAVSGYRWRRKMVMAVEAITSFSDRPLVLIFVTGSLISMAASLYIIYIVVRWVIRGVPITGWPSLIVSIWFLGGLTIAFIGVLGIYLSKIYIETKRRPRSVVRKIYGRPDPSVRS